MSVWDRLDEIQARADHATDGVWGVDGYDQCYVVSSDADDDGRPWMDCRVSNADDAVFIAHARTDVPRLVEALRRVLDRHRPVEVEPSDTICGNCSFQLPNGRYFGKVEEWPCDTVRAVEAALGEGQ